MDINLQLFCVLSLMVFDNLDQSGYNGHMNKDMEVKHENSCNF